VSLILTVFFDDPFWVGLFTLSEGAQAQYCRVVFGGEPSDLEIYDFLQRNYHNLKFSKSLPAPPEEPAIKNPKRRQREVSKSLQQRAGEKKSYEIIKQSLQQTQKALKKAARKQREIEHQDLIYQIKQTKKKEKHRGH
jgi:hypothetical protein